MRAIAVAIAVAVAVVVSWSSGCTRSYGPARPRPATGARVSHAANVALAAANFGLNFFETYASKRGADRLGPTEWTHYRQGVSSQPVPSIPMFQLGSLAAGGSTLYFDRDTGKREFWLVTSGLALAVAGVITTLAITAPVQSDIDGWDPGAPPADWRDSKARLHRANVIRTAIHGAALVVNVTALTVAW